MNDLDKRGALQDLNEHLGSGSKVQLDRGQFDPCNGFVLKMSSELVLVRTLTDFKVDGFAVMRLRDIKEVFSGESERFFERVLGAEGRLSDLDELPPVDLSSFRSVLDSLHRVDPYVIIECEGAVDEDGMGEFYFGEIVGLQEDFVTMSLIHVDGTIDPQQEDVDFCAITILRFREDYIEMFKKHSAWADPPPK